jgi:hypothetical protein
LLIFQAALVLGIVLFNLGFLITSSEENEPRAAMMAGVLPVFLIGLELGIFLVDVGLIIPFCRYGDAGGCRVASGAVIYFLCRRTGPNQWALEGTVRWKLNAEICFGYWGKVGTDCNVGMQVSPWSQVRTVPHRILISLVVRN